MKYLYSDTPERFIVCLIFFYDFLCPESYIHSDYEEESGYADNIYPKHLREESRELFLKNYHI